MKIYTIEAYTTLYCVPGTSISTDDLGAIRENYPDEDIEIVNAPDGIDADYDGPYWPDVD